MSNDTIKVASYATQTCDRYISDLDKIYDLLRVDENLGIYFDIKKKMNNLVTNNTRDELEFDEIEYEKSLNKKNNNNKYSIRLEKREEDINNISNISVLQIKKRITDPKDKDLFIKKLYQLSLEKKQILKSSQNKFEATYVKK